MGITTTFVVVVMLLLFSASCSKEHKEVVDVEFDPDKTYTMKATDVSSLIPSGKYQWGSAAFP